MDTPFLPARYRLIRTLGEGGVGRVLLADDAGRDGLRVAVKLLAPLDREAEDDWARRLIEEARVLERLVHPNIVKLLDVGRLDSGRPFLVFELVEGTDLARLLDEQAPLTCDAALAYALPVLAALGHAHAHGVIHRDVKPANVLVRTDGTPLLADFGCARSADRTIKTQAGIVLGTPGYVAPEVLVAEEPVPASDLYGMGCVLHEALVGRPAFTAGSPAELLLAHLRETLPPTGLARPLDRVLRQALAKDPAARFADAAGMAAALEEAAAEVRRSAAPSRTRRMEGPRGGETAPEPAARVDDTLTGARRPSARGGATVVAKSERIARRAARYQAVRRGAALGALAIAVLALGAWLHVRSQRSAAVNPVITTNTRGQLKAVWDSLRPTCCVLRVTESGRPGAVPREVTEHEAQAAHAVVIEGLLARVPYEVTLATVEGDALYQGVAELPDDDEVRVESNQATNTRIEVALRPGTHSIELSRDPERPLVPAILSVTHAVFELDVPRALLPGGMEVRTTDAHGVRSLRPVPSGTDAVKRVLADLKPVVLEGMFHALTEPPYWTGHAHPAWPNIGNPFTRTISRRRDDCHERLKLDAEGFGRMVRARLADNTGGRLLLDLAPTLPLFFQSPAVETALKRALYERLLQVEWLDRLCIAQFERPALDVRAWYAPYVSYGYALSARESELRDACHVISKCRAFVDETGFDADTLDMLKVTHPGYAQFCLGRDTTAATIRNYAEPLSALATMYPQARQAGLFRRTGHALLRARVAMLEPTHALEVVFTGADPKEALVVALAQPGTDDWRQEMDELLPDGRYVVVLKDRDPVLWGEISVAFDAALLPTGKLDLAVRYRRVPGLAPQRLTQTPCFATLGSLRMRITD